MPSGRKLKRSLILSKADDRHLYRPAGGRSSVESAPARSERVRQRFVEGGLQRALNVPPDNQLTAG